MSVARLNKDFRGAWSPLVSVISTAIDLLGKTPTTDFELHFFGSESEPLLKIVGSWTKARGIVFTMPETKFIVGNLSKGQEQALLLQGWRRSKDTGSISYVYALHGLMRSTFLGGAVVDAVKQILGDDPYKCFLLNFEGRQITAMNLELFEPCKEVVGHFRILKR